MNMGIPVYTVELPEDVFEQKIHMDEKDVNDNGQMLWGALARRMQPVTEAHLSACGLDWNALHEAGKTWVIAWSGMEIQRLPRLGEDVIIRIWPCKNKMMMHTRKYAFYTSQGEPLLSAASIFLLMRIKERTATESGEEFPVIPIVTLPNEPALPKMRVPMPKELTQQRMRKVTASEIDHNRHMNNSHYLDWVQALMDGDDRQPSSIWIQYNKELLEGQQATINYECNETELAGRIVGDEDAFAFRILF